MTDTKRSSLQDYAARRFVLSGTSVIKDHFPYCSPTESLGFGGPSAAHSMVSFAQYDYLDLGADQRILAAACNSVMENGVGTGASRLVGGERELHRALERELAEFIGVEDVLSLVSGYSTNVALIGHLLTKGDLIIADETAHNSIMAGAQLSRASALTFRHNDLAHLDALLERERGKVNRVLIVIEGLYSMDGDVPDLPKIIQLCRHHKAWLMIDEAHSIGVLGNSGRGITEYFDVDPADVDLIVGTLSKAFVSCGGFIGGKRAVIDWLRFTLPGFVYSVGMPPPSVAAARCALEILRREPDRLLRLHSNAQYFVTQSRFYGLNVGTSQSIAIIPILFEDTAAAIAAGNAALEAGFFVPPIAQIAVPRNAPRLRFFVTAAHSRQQIDGVLKTLARFHADRNAVRGCPNRIRQMATDSVI